MNGLTYAMFYRSQRVLRGLLLLVMAWFLGASGIVHSHASSPLRPPAPVVQTATQVDEPVMAADSEDDDCAICWWKARTPYVPSPSQPEDVACLGTMAYRATSPRAPPSGVLERPRTRAPPSLRS